MANPIDTTRDGGAFIGSREKAKNGYGQNGYQGPSSVPTNKQPKLGEPEITPKSAAVPGLDHRDTLAARTSGGTIKAHDSMANKGDGSPSGKVGANSRPSSEPAALGTFNRN